MDDESSRKVSTTPAEATDRFATSKAERAEFSRLMSGGRMSSYDDAVTAAGGTGDELEHYSYNMALAAAYLGPLHILEVAARNALHLQLSAYSGRADWWESSVVTLVSSQLRAITEAEDKVDSQLSKKQQANRPRTFGRTPDDVVAALPFGFWCGLLGRGDIRSGPQLEYEKTLWQPAIRHSFPHYRGNRGPLWVRFDAVRELRNRITHHEPVHHLDVTVQTKEILRLISYVSAPIATWTNRRTRLGHLASNPPGSTTPVRVF